MNLEVYQRCTKRGRFAEIEVQSESSGNVYSVLITDPTDPTEAICECRAFRFSKHGTCKHQDIAIYSLCDWTSKSGSQQSLFERIGMQCPECGSNTEWIMENNESH